MTNRDFKNKVDKEIPQLVLDYLTAEEDIHFNLETLSNSIFTKVYFRLFPFLELFLIISTIIQFSGIDLFFIILILVIVGFLLLGIALEKSTLGKDEYQLIISNKAIYLMCFGDLERVELISIKAILVKEDKRFGRVLGSGTIYFVWDIGTSLSIGRKPLNARINIKGVPDLYSNLKIIESIFMHFGNVRKRCEKISSEKGIDNYYEFKPSQEVSSNLKRRIIISNIGQIIFWILSAISIIFLFSINRIVWYISFLIFMLSLVVIVIELTANLPFRRVNVFWEKRLQIHNKKLVLGKKEKSYEFKFNPKLQLEPRIVNYRNSFIGTITCQESPNSSPKLKLGPYKNYTQVLETLYMTLLLWKDNQNLILSKNEIDDLRKSPSDFKSQRLKSKIEGKIIKWSDFKEISLDSIVLPSDKIQEIQKRLNSNEQILISYRATIKLNIKVIKIIFSFISIIIAIVLWILYFYLKLDDLYSTIIFVTAFLLPIFGLVMIYTEYEIKRSSYIFTNQKILIVFIRKIIDIPYDDFSRVNLKEKRLSNTIFIIPKPTSKYRQDVSIEYVPKESDLYEKILFLKDNYKKWKWK